MHALKRVNLIAPHYRQYLHRTFERVDHQPAPPGDLLHGWAEHAGQRCEDATLNGWLAEALDRQGHFADTHPTLRARLAALAHDGDSLQALPPALAGPSAAWAWFGNALAGLRGELQARWANEVAQPWAERDVQRQEVRERLRALRALGARGSDDEIEMLRLTMHHEPEADVCTPLQAFNARHPGHALGPCSWKARRA